MRRLLLLLMTVACCLVLQAQAAYQLAGNQQVQMPAVVMPHASVNGLDVFFAHPKQNTAAYIPQTTFSGQGFGEYCLFHLPERKYGRTSSSSSFGGYGLRGYSANQLTRTTVETPQFSGAVNVMGIGEDDKTDAEGTSQWADPYAPIGDAPWGLIVLLAGGLAWGRKRREKYIGGGSDQSRRREERGPAEKRRRQT